MKYKKICKLELRRRDKSQPIHLKKGKLRIQSFTIVILNYIAWFTNKQMFYEN